MKLLFILDNSSFAENYLQIAADVADYCDMIWYRTKDITVAEIYTKACALREVLPARKLILSEHADIAVATGFDGVHLGSNSMPTHAVKNAFPRLIVGYSAHSVDECNLDADYITLSPVFDTPKPYQVNPLGLINSPAPNVYALGGINADNAALLKGLGYAGVAGISMYKEIQKVYELIR